LASLASWPTGFQLGFFFMFTLYLLILSNLSTWVSPCVMLQVFLPATKPQLLVGVVDGSSPAAPLPPNLAQVKLALAR
jgi:hypothetical protein